MPWTTPITWSNSAIVGQSQLNEQIRDNLNFLRAPSFSMISTAHTAAAKITASASTAIPITAGISATLTTYGGDLNVCFKAKLTGAGYAIFNLEYNGTAYTDRPSGITNTFQNEEVSFNVWVTGLASGSNSFVPTWKSPGGGTMGIDASSYNLEFWVREG